MVDSTPVKIQLNLDTLDREQVVGVPSKRPDLFTVTFGGKQISFEDPAELPWDIIARMDETPTRFFRTTITDEDQLKHFQLHSSKLVGWKLRALMEAYRDYYGIDEQGNVVGSRR